MRHGGDDEGDDDKGDEEEEGEFLEEGEIVDIPGECRRQDPPQKEEGINAPCQQAPQGGHFSAYIFCHFSHTTISIYYGMKRKRKKSFLLWGIGILLLLFALLSATHLQKSFAVYKTAQERRDKAYSEKHYVERQLEDMRTHAQKRQYDSKNTGIAKKEDKLKKIELRGVTLSPDKNRPFSKSEEQFNVIEQE